EELVFYIKNQLDAGVDKDSIITTLQSQGGWSIEYITEAFLQIEEANEMAVLVSSVEKPELSQKKQETEQDSVTHKPTNDLLKTQSADKRVITAYNSEKAQTDSSPCITANGFNVCKHGKEDTVATNFLKFGTKIRIPNLFGDKIFIVRDRMHKRHSNKVDVWMINKKDAIKFGVKIAKVEVVE
ncbi:3D domain-containing protein, partial [Patescibacteria group bacterium]|nr:3D domain-containing protein [Patescibacteria group bacterium]